MSSILGEYGTNGYLWTAQQLTDREAVNCLELSEMEQIVKAVVDAFNNFLSA